jgi:hypothetical protein
MYNLEAIEYLLVAVLIALQLLTAFRSFWKIMTYRMMIPNTISLAAGNTLHYDGMDDDKYKQRKALITNINNYLLKNKGSAPDFNQVMDMVERNTGVLEEEINHNLSVPLYLGIMGTMIGIVLGLWNMSDLAAGMDSSNAGDALGQGINILLGGVKIAMLASFTGILLTVFNSSFTFSRARRRLERNKNNLYNFIQTELLPVISKDLNVVMQTLQNNMMLFTQRFDDNLGRLEGLLNKNYDTLQAQDNILTALKDIDVTRFVSANVSILSELRKGTDKLEKFNLYLDQMNSFVSSSQQLADSFNSLLQRTSHIDEIAQGIELQFTLSTDLLQFLKSHFAQLEARGSLIQQSMIGIDTVLDDSLNQLKEHITAKITAIKEMTITEQELFAKSLDSNREGLGKLKYLESIDAAINNLHVQQKENSHVVYKNLGKIEERLDQLYNVLHKQAARQEKNVFKTILKKMKFGKK